MEHAAPQEKLQCSTAIMPKYIRRVQVIIFGGSTSERLSAFRICRNRMRYKLLSSFSFITFFKAPFWSAIIRDASFAIWALLYLMTNSLIFTSNSVHTSNFELLIKIIFLCNYYIVSKTLDCSRDLKNKIYALRFEY